MQVDISFPTGHCQRQDDGWGRVFGQMGFSSIRWEEVWLDQWKQIAGSNYKSCSDKTHSFQELSKKWRPRAARTQKKAGKPTLSSDRALSTFLPAFAQSYQLLRKLLRALIALFELY